jgi:hypothetical protein
MEFTNVCVSSLILTTNHAFSRGFANVLAISLFSTRIVAACMKWMWIVCKRHGYWNIKGWGHFVAFFWRNRFNFLRFAWYHFAQTVVPLRYRI